MAQNAKPNNDLDLKDPKLSKEELAQRREEISEFYKIIYLILKFKLNMKGY